MTIDEFTEQARARDGLLLELLGHEVTRGVVRMRDLGTWPTTDAWAPQLWTAWWCYCGFNAVGDAELDPLIRKWHDKECT